MYIPAWFLVAVLVLAIIAVPVLRRIAFWLFCAAIVCGGIGCAWYYCYTLTGSWHFKEVAILAMLLGIWVVSSIIDKAIAKWDPPWAEGSRTREWKRSQRNLEYRDANGDPMTVVEAFQHWRRKRAMAAEKRTRRMKT